MSSEKFDARLMAPVSRKMHPHAHNSDYYFKCLVGGMLACGLTHMAVTPLDVVKCKMQVDYTKYKGLFSGVGVVLREEGARGLTTGWLPTLLGYSAQGAFKYGLYEYFKDVYGNMVGEENYAKYKGLVWCAASASGEFFADIALVPMEMVKVKMQTSKTGTWPTTFGPALSKMSAEKSVTRFPFGSLVPLWSRQIPYTMAKFYLFENIVELFYKHVFTKGKDNYGKGTQIGVAFVSGYLAGIGCAVVSHPADNLVSQLSKAENKGKGIAKIASEVGTWNLVSKGLGARVLMVGTLTGLQWLIYDAWKVQFGLGTTGGNTEQKK